MLDIKFDIVSREIILSGSLGDGNNDFELQLNPSVQNGGIIFSSRCAFHSAPMLGISIEEVINAGMTKVTYEMNRWKKQVQDDGATVAKWTASNAGADTKIQQEVSYL